MPALRERPEDIAPIASYYLREYVRQYESELDTDLLLEKVTDEFMVYPCDDAGHKFNGNRQRVAAFLGISTTKLWRRLNGMSQSDAADVGCS